MAPEQVTDSAKTDAAADVFALGAVLGYAATGTNPFGKGPVEVLLSRVVSSEPLLQEIDDPALRDLIARCLSKEPSERPAPGVVLLELAPRAPSPEALLGTAWLPESFSADITNLTPTPPLPPETDGPPPSASRRAILVVGASGLAGVAVTALGITLARRLGSGGQGSAPDPGGEETATSSPSRPSTAQQWQQDVPVAKIGGLAVTGGLVFVAGGESGIHALDAETGASRWRVALRPESGPLHPFAPLIAEDIVYLRDNRAISACDLKTGEVRWTHPLPTHSGQDPIMTSARGLVVAAAAEEIVAFDAATGDRRWARPAEARGGGEGSGAWSTSSPCRGTAVARSRPWTCSTVAPGGGASSVISVPPAAW